MKVKPFETILVEIGFMEDRLMITRLTSERRGVQPAWAHVRPENPAEVVTYLFYDEVRKLFNEHMWTDREDLDSIIVGSDE